MLNSHLTPLKIVALAGALVLGLGNATAFAGSHGHDHAGHDHDHAGHDHGKKASSPADAALQKLAEGNARFVSGEMIHPNLSKEKRAELAKGQSPYAIIVSCSDSRVPPELVFDAGPGDLFIIRVAGNVVGDDAMASIEYAVAVLGSPLVVVMGHESCGAVGAAVKSETENTEFGGSIHDLVETIRPSVQTAMKRAKGKDVLEAAIEDNAVRVAGELANSKPYVGAAAADGKVHVLAARYDLDTGAVTLYDKGSCSSCSNCSGAAAAKCCGSCGGDKQAKCCGVCGGEAKKAE